MIPKNYCIVSWQHEMIDQVSQFGIQS